MPTAARGAHLLHYEAWGEPSAPPFLFIMGLALSSRAWVDLPQRIAALGFRTLAFDHRGIGRSRGPLRPFRLGELAEDARAVLDAAAIPDAHVFGISMGGLVAQELAARHPARLRSLALGCTFPRWLTAAKPALRAAADLLLLNTASVFATRERVSRLLVSREFARHNPTAAVDWIRAAEAVSPVAALAQLAALVAHRPPRGLRELRVPTLVLTGDEDRLVPPENSRTLARLIPCARLEILRGAGHAFPLERPEETARLLADHARASERSVTAR